LAGRDDDSPYDEYSHEELAGEFYGRFTGEHYDDFVWERLDSDSLSAALEIMDNVIAAGYYPSDDTLDRLSALTDLYRDELTDYFEGMDIEWEEYPET
jgi:hypothetical protein